MEDFRLCTGRRLTWFSLRAGGNLAAPLAALGVGDEPSVNLIGAVPNNKQTSLTADHQSHI
jgi:hypothetical protein